MRRKPSKAQTGSDVRRSPFTLRFSAPFILAIRLYQALLGPFLGGQCRFYPTCSNYAIEAYQTHGPIRGTWLTIRRLAKCHPLCRGGVDPVPLPGEIKHRPGTR